jgi:hypothetical protein
MVSSALDLSLEELLVTLDRLRAELSNDSDYVKLRSTLPPEWPL